MIIILRLLINNLFSADIKIRRNRFSIYNHKWHILKELCLLEYANEDQLPVRKVKNILTFPSMHRNVPVN